MWVTLKKIEDVNALCERLGLNPTTYVCPKCKAALPIRIPDKELPNYRVHNVPPDTAVLVHNGTGLRYVAEKISSYGSMPHVCKTVPVV